ncbi:WD repeat-containing protein 44 [Heracleum sosnowskyi]|uniref:WD repeat-containing protein 44 n=1 Tax=Heracleum sosnowskyi TaxID=360622 RepID=A0AAD8IQY4_9APIA|nr:WD repeat-containing protein 44 [Heracleum sosnowskyi]
MDRRRTLTMNWDRSGDVDNDFFNPLGDSGSDDEDYDDNRMSFASAVSSSPLEELRSFKSSTNTTSMYSMWMEEPGNIQDRRKRLFQGMGLNSNRDLLSNVSTKYDRGVSEEAEIQGKVDNDSTKRQESKQDPKTKDQNRAQIATETFNRPLPRTATVHVRSRSDGEMGSLTFETQRREERLIGAVSKQRLTRTSSVIMKPNGCLSSARNLRKSSLRISALDDKSGSLFFIKNVETGTEFIVNEHGDKGLRNKLSELQTGKQLSVEEVEKSVGYSPVVKELMRRESGKINPDDDTKVDSNSTFSKKFRNSKRIGVSFFKNLKGKANNMSANKGDKEKSQQQSTPEQRSNKNSFSQWVKVRHHRKTYKEFTGLHLCQEIQAHEGSIWTIKFSSDARFLASAGQDRVIHVREVQECDVMPAKPPDHDMNSVREHPEKKTKAKNSSKKEENSIPSYVEMPETVFGLSERPLCSFTGHQDDILDLSWSKSEFLLSSSMDKTVRLWDMKTKNCLKMFAHNDYVTCIQFNPMDDDYFLSGSLDAKIRMWNVPDRQVVDWIDLSEMVTAACYSPDGQGAVVGSHNGTCRLYSTTDCKLEQKQNVDIQLRKKVQSKKFTGFQYNPSNPSEMLITSADSRIRIFDGSQITYKFRGFRNTSSQIASSFTPDGKYVISASEDSQVYIWNRENGEHGKSKTILSVPSHEQFSCKDVSVAIPWPGSSKKEVPVVEIHPKKNTKRITPRSQSSTNTPTKSKGQLPPLPRNNSHSERVPSSPEKKDQDQISRTESGIGESFSSASGLTRDDPSSISNSSRNSGSQSWSSSRSWFDVGHCHGHTVEATAWGLVIVTAGFGGEIRAYQNFGLPLKASRHPYLFRDLT